MADVTISTRGLNCPQPFIETSKALRKMAAGQTLDVEGDNPVSRREIAMQVQELGYEVVTAEDRPDGTWTLTIRKNA